MNTPVFAPSINRQLSATLKRFAWSASLLALLAGHAIGQDAPMVTQLGPDGRPMTQGRPGGAQPQNQPQNQNQPELQGRQPNPLQAGAGNNPIRPDMLPPENDMVTFSAFAEPVELKTLVSFVAEALQINVVGSDALTGSIVFNAPVSVPKSDLLGLLGSLLEQQGFAIIGDPSGFYRVLDSKSVPMGFPKELATTRVIATPTLKPSSLTDAVTKQMTDPQSNPVPKIAFLDDLGVIVITDTPRRVEALEQLIARILEQKRQQSFQRFELEHVSAATARQRAIELIGQVQQPLGGGGAPGVPGVPQVSPGGSPSSSLNNLADRLTVDAQGNALIFRGTEEESRELTAVLEVIDVRSTLEIRQYFAGSAAADISKIASGKGLGSVITIEGSPEPGSPQGMMPAPQMPGTDPSQGANSAGGPTMVVDLGRGRILYYGTPTQHRELGRLISLFDTKQDAVVIEFYKLKNAKAEEVADLLNGMLTNQQASANGNLLPGGGFMQRTRGRGRNQVNEMIFSNGGQSQPQNAAGGNSVRLGAGEDVFVQPDISNNQVLVKAPQKLQKDFKQLIDNLDLRKPQVYLEAIIVAVSASDTMRLAIETQLINAGGSGGVVNTNFGLGNLGTGTGATGSNILNRKTVPGTLAGVTAAIIKSDQVPIVINALARQTNSRILSSPQLLIDNNEEASIVSLEQQPTSVTNLVGGNNEQQTSFGGYEEAGTKLTVTPQISEGNYVRLDYEIELSSFIGTGSDGLPPPKSENTVNSKSVTVPSDATVVVGGLEVEQKGKTVVKVPLLGDIPILGQLFRDDNKNGSKTTLYVFITPKILRDPTFRDLILLTQGPQATAQLPTDEPMLTPRTIDVVDGIASKPANAPANAPLDLPPISPSTVPAPAVATPSRPESTQQPTRGNTGSDPTAWKTPEPAAPPPTPGQIKRQGGGN